MLAVLYQNNTMTFTHAWTKLSLMMTLLSSVELLIDKIDCISDANFSKYEENSDPDVKQCLKDTSVII